MKLRKGFVITIDGPSGTGKSTAAWRLAGRLGILYLDTGAMYRAVGLKALQGGVGLNDRRSLARLAQRSRIRFERGKGGAVRVFLDGKEVTRAIRRPEVSDAASQVAVVAGVRRALVARQRQIGSRAPLVAEGRDTGTVVFPKAQVKVYLTASLIARAKRRRRDIETEGRSMPLSAVVRDTRRRDRRDRARAHSPLKRAPGAIRIDNTALQPDEVLVKILDYVYRANSRGRRAV